VTATFQGAVLRAVGSPLTVESLTLAPLQPSDVLVRIMASGLCHSDLEIIQGSLQMRLPTVLGHEGAGIVEEVGSAVTHVAPGDHVVASWIPNCGDCFYCIRDLPVLCERNASAGAKGGLPDGASRLASGTGPINHFSFISSHAEYAVLTANGAIKVTRDIPFDRACLLGCAVATGVGGATRVARVTLGSTVAVVGCGAVGLSSIQGARMAGADTIVGIDLDPARLELATRLGATDVVDARTEDPISVVRRLTGGRGVDVAIEAGGRQATMQLAFEVSRPGADIVILGKVGFDDTVSFRFGSMMGERRIIRSSYGGSRPARDFPLLAQAYLDGRLLLDEMITQRIGFGEINAAFDGMAAGTIVRAVLEPAAASPASASSS
jgi:S-(hydroxymethyl)glutathione dehydrogenase/alcohol dehydrogenase